METQYTEYPTRGRIVDYVMRDPNGEESIAPAMVIRVDVPTQERPARLLLGVFDVGDYHIEMDVAAEGEPVAHPRPGDLPQDADWDESPVPATRFWRWPNRI